MPNITPKQLKELRDYLLAGKTDVAGFLNIPESEVKSYTDALAEKYPKDFAKDEESSAFKFQLLTEGNVIQELEVVRETESRLVLRVKEPQELVTIIVKGEAVEVDLYRLRKMSASDVLHGVTVARLIELAEIAKG